MLNPYCYYTVEGLSGGFGDYKKKFDNIVDAVGDYKERGYFEHPSCGDIYLHIFIQENLEQVIKLT